MQVYGYELLYRNNATRNIFDGTEANEASSKVIINSFCEIGIERLTDGKKAFINFTDTLLKEEVATLFPAETLVIEILETVSPVEEIVEKCRILKKSGYTLALDDFVFDKAFEPLLAFIDIIKIEFTYKHLKENMALIEKYRKRGVCLLAEKIETQEEYDMAVKMGFSYFQGYFFSKPVIVSRQNITQLEVNHFRLMKEINQGPYNVSALTNIISSDVSLTYKLLRLVNSVGFGFRFRIQTVRHALVALGELEVRKWASLISMMGIRKDQSEELIRLSLIRAKFSESLAVSFRMPDQAPALFLMGMFSLMHVIMGYSMEDLFEEITLSPLGKDALQNGTGPLAPVLRVMLAHEQGNWLELATLCMDANCTMEAVADAYVEAVMWANNIFKIDVRVEDRIIS